MRQILQDTFVIRMRIKRHAETSFHTEDIHSLTLKGPGITGNLLEDYWIQ